MSVVPIWDCLNCKKTVKGSICKCGQTHYDNIRYLLSNNSGKKSKLMKYDIWFNKNCYFCGDPYTRGVLYREEGKPKKDAIKIRICEKHFKEMKVDKQ